MKTENETKMDGLIAQLFDTIPDWEMAIEMERDGISPLEDEFGDDEDENDEIQEKINMKEEFISAAEDIIEYPHLFQNIWNEKILSDIPKELNNLWRCLAKANEHCDSEVVSLHGNAMDPTCRIFNEINDLVKVMLEENKNEKQ